MRVHRYQHGYMKLLQNYVLQVGSAQYLNVFNFNMTFTIVCILRNFGFTSKKTFAPHNIMHRYIFLNFYR